MDDIVLDEIESVFPDKEAHVLKKADLETILLLERKHKKQTLFYKAKNQATPDIFTIYYNRAGDEVKALSEGLVKGYVICKFNNCDAFLKYPGGSIKY
jgi:hypothetical protein